MGLTDRILDDVKRRLSKRLQLRRKMAGGVVTRFIDVSVPDLAPGLDGFRIVQISDLHIGAGMWEPEYAAEAARAVRAAHPSLVVNTGDFIQGEPHWDKVTSLTTEFLLDESETSYSPANVAILGNHDYYLEDDVVYELIQHLEGIGLTMLINRVLCVSGPGGGVSVAGFSEEAPGFDEAVAAFQSAGGPRIALVHEPEVAERLPPGTAHIVLAGHTHGGQITFPGLESTIVERFCGSHYVSGLYRVNNMPLWVNRGLGCTGIPLRFRAAPEVTVIRLVR